MSAAGAPEKATTDAKSNKKEPWIVKANQLLDARDWPVLEEYLASTECDTPGDLSAYADVDKKDDPFERLCDGIRDWKREDYHKDLITNEECSKWRTFMPRYAYKYNDPVHATRIERLRMSNGEYMNAHHVCALYRQPNPVKQELIKTNTIAYNPLYFVKIATFQARVRVYVS